MLGTGNRAQCFLCLISFHPCNLVKYSNYPHFTDKKKMWLRRVKHISPSPASSKWERNGLIEQTDFQASSNHSMNLRCLLRQMHPRTPPGGSQSQETRVKIEKHLARRDPPPNPVTTLSDKRYTGPASPHHLCFIRTEPLLVHSARLNILRAAFIKYFLIRLN